MVVVDEAHNLRNPGTLARGRAAHGCSPARRRRSSCC